MDRVEKIAVVEDDKAIRESYADMLKSFGYRPSLFASAEDFLHEGIGVDFDCLILDCRLPGMSGLDLQQILRDRQIPLPIIFVSAQYDEATTKRALANGAVSFLNKPISDDVFIEKLNIALGSRN